MPTTVTGAGILFPDGTSQLTAAVASTDFGAVGSYAVLMMGVNTNLGIGGTIAGSSLRYNSVSSSFGGSVGRVNNSGYNGGGTALSGTWRKMSGGNTYRVDQSGESQYGYTYTYLWFDALYVRIS